MDLKGAVCFLVINHIEELPRLSILSCLRNSNLPVLVGYISENDILPLRDLPVEFVRIHENESPLSVGDYSAFDQSDFYRIVMNKWELLLQNLPQYDFLIYSDIDVIWIRDAAAEIASIFCGNKEIDLIMQSFGESELNPSLCMGFIGVRNSERAINFLNVAQSKHKDLMVGSARIGDDDVATAVIKDLSYPNWLHRLSPVYFPVGNLLTLFARKQSFPGLQSPVPFIFHLNYVIGLENKRLMLRVISRDNPLWLINSRMTTVWRAKLILKRIRFELGTFRRKFQ
jgi:hypothetical protein